jgi:hypothetical protein
LGFKHGRNELGESVAFEFLPEKNSDLVLRELLQVGRGLGV